MMTKIIYGLIYQLLRFLKKVYKLKSTTQNMEMKSDKFFTTKRHLKSKRKQIEKL